MFWHFVYIDCFSHVSDQGTSYQFSIAKFKRPRSSAILLTSRFKSTVVKVCCLYDYINNRYINNNNIKTYRLQPPKLKSKDQVTKGKENFMWTDTEVELLLSITQEYKT